MGFQRFVAMFPWRDFLFLGKLFTWSRTRAPLLTPQTHAQLQNGKWQRESMENEWWMTWSTNLENIRKTESVNYYHFEGNAAHSKYPTTTIEKAAVNDQIGSCQPNEVNGPINVFHEFALRSQLSCVCMALWPWPCDARKMVSKSPPEFEMMSRARIWK